MKINIFAICLAALVVLAVLPMAVTAKPAARADTLLTITAPGTVEAGESFGAGPWQRFRRIALPLILPGIVSGALLAVISALGEFVSSILLYTYSSRPISIEILSQLRTFNFGAAAAYCVLLLVLILAIVWGSNALVGKAPVGSKK
jgi:ABC-type Fe3+ transport system permease subunit